MPNDRRHTTVPTPCQRATLRMCLLLLSLTITDVINLEITSQCPSSFHPENEPDQPDIRSLSTEEKTALSHRILKQLGLPDTPKSSRGTASTNHSARKFLINTYKHIANKSAEKSDESPETSEFDLTDSDLRTIDQSDVIIALTAQQSHQGVEDLMWFDVAALPPKYHMTSSKLRLYRALGAKNPENRGAFTVTAYRVSRPKDGEAEMRFVDSANLTAEHEGWITLDVTESLRHWMEHPDDNNGLHLSVGRGDSSSRGTRPEDIGIVRFDGYVERRPFVAGFFRGSEFDEARAAESKRFEVHNERNRKRDTLRRKSVNSCKVQKLYVSFKDFHWDNWIAFPPGFDANYCSGECSFPLSSHMNATNHAIVQTIANLMYPQKVPKICCVPTVLQAIDVLYYINDNTTVLKRWGITNMSVQSCGCR